MATLRTPMPTRTTPLVAPNLPPLAQAPTAQTVGAFQAPDASSLASDPGVQFRMQQANLGRERSAAQRGSLLSGGFQTELAKLNQGLASQEYGNLYDRALRTYGANRDTTQQNFGQSLASFGAQRDVYGDARDAAMQQADTLNANSGADDAYARQMADYNAAVQAQRDEGVPAAMPRVGGGGMGGRPLGSSGMNPSSMIDYRANLPQLSSNATRLRESIAQGRPFSSLRSFVAR